MHLALEQARLAAARGEVPVGAVVLDGNGAVLAAAGNEVEARADPTAHAEMLALRAAAAARGAPRLPDCDLYVTLEPCAMCAAAISLFRVRRLVFGAYDPKGGGVEHGPRFFTQPTCLHAPGVVGGVLEGEAAALLRAFFAARRDQPSPALVRERVAPKAPGEGGAVPRKVPGYTTRRARALQQNQTDAELALWNRLRNRQILGAKFKRQEPVAGVIADFLCAEAMLIVEVDGGQHRAEADALRTTALNRAGFLVLRFWNNEVLENIAGVLETIARTVVERRGK